MSKTKTETVIADETFASKLGIDMVSPRTFEELIEMHAGTRIVVQTEDGSYVERAKD